MYMYTSKKAKLLFSLFALFVCVFTFFQLTFSLFHLLTAAQAPPTHCCVATVVHV